MIAKAVSWSMLSAILNICAQVVVMAILSRLLKPEDFGLYASAGLGMRFISYFAQMGMGPALIQRGELSVDTRKTALFAAAVIGIVAWAAVFAIAVPAAAFFRDDRLLSLLPVIGFALLLGGLSSVPLAVLRRDLDFRRLAIIEVAGMALGYCVLSVICARSGLGAWSLVAGVLAQELITLCGSFLLAKGIWCGRINWAELKTLWRYGSRYSFIGFMDFISSNVEILFIGRMLGVSRLGIYNRAQSITGLPVELVMSALARVVFPAFARIRKQPGHLGAGFLVVLQGNLLFAMPIGLGMAAAAYDLVAVWLGPNWEAAAEAAAVYAFAIPWFHVSTVSGILMDAEGAFRRKGVMILAVTICKLALMALFAQYGLQGIALAMLMGEALRAAYSLAIVRRLAGVSRSALLTVFARAFLVAAPVWAAVSAVAWYARSTSITPYIALPVEIAIAALLFLGLGRLQLIKALNDPNVIPVESELSGLRRALRAA